MFGAVVHAMDNFLTNLIERVKQNRIKTQETTFLEVVQ